MAQLVIRNLDEGVKQRLKDRARRHGRTMEAEARAILRDAAEGEAQADQLPVGQRIAAMFAPFGLQPGELEVLPRTELKSPFEDDHR